MKQINYMVFMTLVVFILIFLILSSTSVGYEYFGEDLTGMEFIEEQNEFEFQTGKKILGIYSTCNFYGVFYEKYWFPFHIYTINYCNNDELVITFFWEYF